MVSDIVFNIGSDIHSQNTCEPPAIPSGTPELEWTPLSCGMAGCWQIDNALTNIGL